MDENGRIKGEIADINQDLTVGGNTTTGSLDVTNDAAIGGDLTVNGNAKVAGDAQVDGNLGVNGNTSIAGDLNVTGDSKFDGDIYAGKNMHVSRDIYVGGDSTVAGNQYVGGNLSVAGDSAFAGSVTVGQNLDVMGNANVDGTLTANQIVVGGKDVNREFNRLDNRIDKVGAQSAALAGLKPVDTDADQVWSLSASYGNYKGENAGAFGIFYRPHERVLIGASSTVGDSDNMFNVSASFALNKGKNSNMGKAAMAKEMNALKADNEALKRALVQLNRKLDSLTGGAAPVQRASAPAPQARPAQVASNADRMAKANEIYQAMMNGADVDFNLINEYAVELRQIADAYGK